MNKYICPKCNKPTYGAYTGTDTALHICGDCQSKGNNKVILSLSHGFLDVLQKPAGIIIELHDHDDPAYEDGRAQMYNADEVIDDSVQ